MVFAQRAVRTRNGRLRRLPALRSGGRVNTHFRGIIPKVPRRFQRLQVGRNHQNLRERARRAEVKLRHTGAEVRRLHDGVILQRAGHIRTVLSATHNQVRRHVSRERRCAYIIVRVAQLLDIRAEFHEIKVQIPVERGVGHRFQAVGQRNLGQRIARVERAPGNILHALGDNHALNDAVVAERLAVDGNRAVLHDNLGGFAGRRRLHQVQPVVLLCVQHVVNRGIHRVGRRNRQRFERGRARHAAEQVGSAAGQARANVRRRHASEVLERIGAHLGDGIGQDDGFQRAVVRCVVGIAAVIVVATGRFLIGKRQLADLRQLVQVATQVHRFQRRALRERARRNLGNAADVGVRKRRATHKRLLAHGGAAIG